MSKDYIQQLKDDTIHQFTGKANIEALNEAVGRQLNELRAFYEQLATERALTTASGIQLDAIGDILGMTRKQAYEIIGNVEDSALSDDDYRSMLAYKIILNFGHATYYDIVRGIRKFYHIFPIQYHEDVEFPAAFRIEIRVESGHDIILNNLIPIKAAGVNCSFEFKLYQRIEVDSEVSTYGYDMPECGTLLCGTYPSTATLGNSQGAETDVSYEYVGTVYIVPFTGTVPDTATEGYAASFEVDASGSIEGSAYCSNAAGDVLTGTTPGTATVGDSEESGTVDVSEDIDGNAYGVAYAGTVPETAVAYGSAEAETEASVAASAYMATVNVCGTTYCGE